MGLAAASGCRGRRLSGSFISSSSQRSHDPHAPSNSLSALSLLMATATSVGAAALAAPAANPNPTTPPFSNDVQWITAYLGIHMLSVPSRRYSYYLWFAVAFVVLVFAVLHWTRARGGFIGACWSRWALRRATWKKSRARKGEAHQPRRSMPSNAQLFAITVIFAVAACLSCVGPDYVRPTESTWGVSRRWDPLQFVGYAPQYTIQKAWWTAGGRTGLIAFALFPLCVLFALKAPPFALFALPYTIQLHFDKLAFLHRWTARIIWLLSTLHVIFWSLQLLRDRKTSPFVDKKDENRIAYAYAWSYTRFIFAWIVSRFTPLTRSFRTLGLPFRRLTVSSRWLSSSPSPPSASIIMKLSTVFTSCLSR